MRLKRSLISILALSFSGLVLGAPPLEPEMGRLFNSVEIVKAYYDQVFATTKQYESLQKKCLNAGNLTEPVVFNCAQDFLEMKFQAKSNLDDEKYVHRELNKLSSDFSSSKLALSELVSKIVSTAKEIESRSTKTLGVFRSLSDQVLRSRYQDARRSGRDAGMMEIVCNYFNDKIDSTKTAIEFGQMINAPYGYYYLQRNKLLGLHLVGQEIKGKCPGDLSLSKIDLLVKNIDPSLTNSKFVEYKRATCPKMKSRTKSQYPNCLALPLNPFSITFLEKVRNGEL